MSRTPEYQAWNHAKQRVFNPDSHAYRHYGGRGLTMEPEWAESFEAFLAEVGERPGPEMSIDRINNDLGYVRGNVRWATPLQQTQNRRKKTHCKHGHEFNEQNTYYLRNGKGRHCRACDRDRRRAERTAA